jgi:hypothetical protein
VTNTGTAHEAFLAELTQTLTTSGWTRTDRNHFAIVTPEFTHPGTPAVLTITITGTAWTGPSAYLLHDNADAWWRVACDNPHPAVLAAAANATLASDVDSTSDGGHDRPLKQLLQEAGWTIAYNPGGNGQILESRWAGPDHSEAVCFPKSTFSTPAWLIHRAETATGDGLAQYTPTPATPTAVLAALALTPAPTSTDPAPPSAPDATA